MTIIRIASGNLGGNTALTVNGSLTDIPHDQDVEVTAEQLHALGNSNVSFSIVDGASAAPEATGGAARGLSAASPDQPARKPRQRKPKAKAVANPAKAPAAPKKPKS